MSAATVRPEAAPTPVRVTIDGEAVALAHAPQLLRVTYGGATLMVRTDHPGVAVEHREPERVWTDGDLVESGTGWIGWRERAAWWTTTQARLGTETTTGPFATDARMSELARDGSVSVLRYQAGEA